ncbi:hypothetical protein ACF07Y_12970 [Streptomyces sp. NPDC016566]|uniref:hypothetical protein n=1 Tax=Streptomyces sp. NPDC016566 TaxID=3364967 RepID=UPI0036F90A40
MSIRRETAHDDRERTWNLMAMLGNSLDPDREPDDFEQVIATALYVNQSARPPAGHAYPRRG